MSKSDEPVTGSGPRGAAVRFDFADYMRRKNAWSIETFGPTQQVSGVLNHIRKELDEVAADPGDVIEWADLIMLATDGAYRAGHSPDDICSALEAKLVICRARNWPDWQTLSHDQPIEHIKPDPTEQSEEQQ